MLHNLKIIRGNLFNSQAQTLVNTVNTVGVMGSGVALEFKLRYPEMYEKYVELCKQKQMQIGKLWLYKTENRWILNFPTKDNWKDDAEIEYLERGLKKFVDLYREKEITSVAFPLLGAQHGNIPKEVSLSIMKKYLSQCNIPVEIYEYDPLASDDLYPILKDKFLKMNAEEIQKETQIKKQYVQRLIDVFNDTSIKSISRLSSAEGIGIKTLEKLFDFLYNRVKMPEQDETKEELIVLAKEHLRPKAYSSFEKYINKRKSIPKALNNILKLIIKNKE